MGTAPRRRPSGYTQPGNWRSTVARILKRDHHRCYLCDDPRPADTVDHVTPVTDGGTHHDDNLKAAHQHPCHADKTERERRAALARRTIRRGNVRPHPNLIP